jgi:hypothetical protein
MGWTTEQAPRMDVVANHKGPYTASSGNRYECVEHHQTRQEDWFLFRKTTPTGESTLFIEVMVWDGGSHKEMGAIEHPYYYACPVEWLDMVPVENEEWRVKVRARGTRRAVA